MLRLPMSSLCCVAVCLVLIWTGLPVLAVVLGVAAYGLLTAWVWRSYAMVDAMGAAMPRWLAWLEYVRECLADEVGPEFEKRSAD